MLCSKCHTDIDSSSIIKNLDKLICFTETFATLTDESKMVNKNQIVLQRSKPQFTNKSKTNIIKSLNNGDEEQKCNILCNETETLLTKKEKEQYYNQLNHFENEIDSSLYKSITFEEEHRPDLQAEQNKMYAVKVTLEKFWQLIQKNNSAQNQLKRISDQICQKEVELKKAKMDLAILIEKEEKMKLETLEELLKLHHAGVLQDEYITLTKKISENAYELQQYIQKYFDCI